MMGWLHNPSSMRGKRPEMTRAQLEHYAHKTKKRRSSRDLARKHAGR